MLSFENNKNKVEKQLEMKSFRLAGFEGKGQVKDLLKAGSLLALNLFMVGQNMLPKSVEKILTNEEIKTEQTQDIQGLYREVEADGYIRDPGHVEYTYNSATGELMCGETAYHVIDEQNLDAEMVVNGEVVYLGETDGMSVVSHKYLESRVYC